MSDTLALAKGSYWDHFYSRTANAKIPVPSQFAAFVAQECADCDNIIEVGCGNGRDSFFFAWQGFNVVGVDGSEKAVAHCKSVNDNFNLNASFLHAVVGSPEFRPLISAAVQPQGKTAIYARFFLHALTEEEEASFLADISACLKPGDLAAFEYRTSRDSGLEKVTPEHYRRYIRPASLFSVAPRLGLAVDYEVEGYGFAKYKNDDAYVARCILRKI